MRWACRASPKLRRVPRSGRAVIKYNILECSLKVCRNLSLGLDLQLERVSFKGLLPNRKSIPAGGLLGSPTRPRLEASRVIPTMSASFQGLPKLYFVAFIWVSSGRFVVYAVDTGKASRPPLAIH
jgi:hypothetical protein